MKVMANSHVPLPNAAEQKFYRPDVDGLRALAVLLVVLFHFEFDWMRGGFVGVDVFFVISGFLITRLIVDDVRAGTFTFANFYIRRTRRLFPSLFATFVISLVAGCILLPAFHVERLAASLVSAVFSLSNFYFWFESGYFDTESISKPLLHTWSLSVEEQFYLLWPALLVAALRRRQTWTIPTAAIAAGIASLLLTELVLRHDASAAFYLLPFRIYEFSIGAACVWLVDHYNLRSWLMEGLMALAYAMIAWAALTFSKNTVFPGLSALVPSLATGVVILFGHKTVLGRLFAMRPVVAIGLVSYSLYLVHWPLFVYAKQLHVGALGLPLKLMLVVASIGLAAAMYRWIEQPVRRPDPARRLPPTRFAAVCVSLAVALAGLSAVAWHNKGWPDAVGADQQTLAHLLNRQADQKQSVSHCSPHRFGCLIGRPLSEDRIDVILAGDSHADHWIFGLHSVLMDANLTGLMVSAGGGVPPLLGASVFQGREPEPKNADRLFSIVSTVRPRTLILAARWQLYFHTTSIDGHAFFLNHGNFRGRTQEVAASAMRDSIRETVRTLKAQNIEIIVLGQVPYFGVDPLNCFSRPAGEVGVVAPPDRNDMSKCHDFTREKAVARARPVDDLFKSLERETGAFTYKSITEEFCRDGRYCASHIGNLFIYRDDDHINTEASRLLARKYLSGLRVR